jgi:hypothetical protein
MFKPACFFLSTANGQPFDEELRLGKSIDILFEGADKTEPLDFGALIFASTLPDSFLRVLQSYRSNQRS